MFTRLTLFLVGLATSVTMATDVLMITSDELQALMSLNQASDDMKNMITPQIMNLQQIENRVINARSSLMNLSDDEETVEKVQEAFSIIGDAIQWANDLAHEFADTKKINDILSFC